MQFNATFLGQGLAFAILIWFVVDFAWTEPRPFEVTMRLR